MGREFDGITIDGKSVEEYLMDDEPEILEANKVYPKHRRSVKHMEHKEKSGPVLTRRKQILDLFCNNPDKEFTTKEIKEILDFKFQTDVSKLMASIWETELAFHMTRTGSKAGGFKYALMEQMDLNRAVRLASLPKPVKGKPRIKPVKGKPRIKPEVKIPVTQDVNLNVKVHVTFTFSIGE